MKTFIASFLENTGKYADNKAITDAKGSYTYKELDEKSNLIAAEIVKRAKTLGKDVVRDIEEGKNGLRVGVLFPRVKDFMVAVIGVMRSGCTFIPIDNSYPIERIRSIVEDSGCSFIVTTSDSQKKHELLSGLNLKSDQYILIDDLKSGNSVVTSYNLARYDNEGAIYYTSGSTGKPKGSRLHHRGLLNFIHSVTQWFKPESTDRISSHRAFSFDAHIEDLYPTLCAGAGLYIMPESIRKDTDAIYDFLIKNKITAGGYSTAIAKLLLSGYDLKQRYITAGGEALTDVTCDKVQIFNVYGPTECTDDTSIYKLEKGRHYEAAPIGRSIQNCYSFITDKYGQLVPQGIAGELCFAGPQVGYGYWHLDEKTKAVFEDCPFVEGTRMYHTGDLAKYNEEGNLEYIGRIDFQVKLRGFRIDECMRSEHKNC